MLAWMLCVVGCLGLAAWAGPPSPSWEGLTGLYTVPTAESLPAGDFAFTFSELRFKQTNSTLRTRNIWYTGSLTYAPFDRWEFAASSRHEYRKIEPHIGGPITTIDDEELLWHAKCIIVPVEPGRIGLAVGVQDATGDTRDLAGLPTERGRRLFLAATYEWATLALTHDGRGLGGAVGARWDVTDNVDIIGEFVTEPVFATVVPEPAIDGNFNIGLRIHPRQVPDLRIDLAAIGDGEFDFGFSFAYVF